MARPGEVLCITGAEELVLCGSWQELFPPSQEKRSPENGPNMGTQSRKIGKPTTRMSTAPESRIP